MFAVVRTGGKQYRVAADQKIIVDRLPGEAGDSVSLGDVLMVGGKDGLKATDGQTVSAEIVAQIKGDKIIVFKKKRRHNYRRRNGHRQQHTVLKILAIGDEQQRAAPAKASQPAPAEQVEAAPAVDTAPVANTTPAAEAAPAAAVDAPAKPKRTPKPKAAPAPNADAE